MAKYAAQDCSTLCCRVVGSGAWATQLQSLIQHVPYRLGMTATPVGKRGWSDALKGMQTILQLDCKEDVVLESDDLRRYDPIS